ncbi:MAG: ACT domain-containing protein [Methanothermobacter thermautotrophicus]|nr:ACT domain-containing protein [Methanothermobacter thermautotrophicus]
MRVKQISIFLENKKGRLWKALSTLAEAGINLRALSLADTSEFGILRLIVPEPEEAAAVLEDKGFVVKIKDVVAVEMDDRPGGLASILEVLKDYDLNLDYIYAFVHEKKDKAILFMSTEDLDALEGALKDAGVRMVPPEEVYSL